MTGDELQGVKDEAYLTGERRAWQAMLLECLRHLGYDDPAAGLVRWVAEREEAVLALRSACEDWGDLEWDADLHLADVINKHLLPHLEANNYPPEGG